MTNGEKEQKPAQTSRSYSRAGRPLPKRLSEPSPKPLTRWRKTNIWDYETGDEKLRVHQKHQSSCVLQLPGLFAAFCGDFAVFSILENHPGIKKPQYNIW